MTLAAPRHATPARWIVRTSLALALAAGTLSAVGCAGGGHGKFTSDQISQAREKLDMIKSGTEWQMANQQFLAGDMDKSLKTVDRSIALNPRVAKSHVLRGRVMLEKSRLEEARNEFLAAEALDPTFVEAQYFLGIVYERVNQPEEALARYKKAMELDPANAQYVVAAAEMLIDQKKLDEAETLLTDRKSFLEYNAAIRQTLGHISMLRGDAAAAAQTFSEALLLAPGDQAITENLVHAQMQSGQFAAAESMLNRLLDKPENAQRRDLKGMRARCLMAINRFVDARTILQEITADKEGSADLRSWMDLGNVAAILHDKASLRSSMQRVMAIAPDRPDGYLLKAMYCRQDNRLDDAIAATDVAISKGGKDASPYVLKAMIQQDQAKIIEARETLAHALERDPANDQARALLGAIVTSHPDAANP
ncbi:MAG TPA: tetratricopeptide repeat protein [Phycisphaerales bacterium]|nr:tetratricopeptide repeat protein [Phycisphaerales bacterium]